MSKLVKASSALPAHVMKDRVVLRLQEAEKALGYAIGIDQVRLVMDVAAAQEVFAKRQKLGNDVIGQAHALRIHAIERLAELTQAMVKATGTRGQLIGRGLIGGSKQIPPIPTLEELGIDKKTANIGRQLLALPKAKREAVAQRETTIAKARREHKAATLPKSLQLPDAKYRVLYADPPWSYNDKADDGSVQAGGAARHYPSMKISELCDLPVVALCEDNAVLFLWTTSPLLFESAAVIRAWGFAYKASFIWDKVKHNMGHYNSVRHEFLLLCTRGSCTPDVVELFDSVQSIERTTHSTKPEEFRTIIETLYPHGKRLELFARREAPGWDSYGNEVVAASA